MNATTAFESWSNTYRERAKVGGSHLWPSETLVRLFRGRFVPDLDREFAGKSVLDVGCGDGNNMLLYAALDMVISGTEVKPEICEQVRERIASVGSSADVRVGTNRELPFESDSFDFLVSWNTIHYESNEEDMRAAIAEYARVLKPGGRFFVSTTGPDHLILEGAHSLGNHRYQIMIDDFRRGEIFFYFDTPHEIHRLFGEQFRDVRVGRDRDELFTKIGDFFLITGVK